jgi:hypothetical protein
MEKSDRYKEFLFIKSFDASKSEVFVNKFCLPNARGYDFVPNSARFVGLKHFMTFDNGFDRDKWDYEHLEFYFMAEEQERVIPGPDYTKQWTEIQRISDKKDFDEKRTYRGNWRDITLKVTVDGANLNPYGYLTEKWKNESYYPEFGLRLTCSVVDDEHLYEDEIALEVNNFLQIGGVQEYAEILKSFKAASWSGDEASLRLQDYIDSRFKPEWERNNFCEACQTDPCQCGRGIYTHDD